MSDCIDLIAFRRQVCRFAEKLSDEQRRSIVYIRLFPLREKYKNAKVLDIFSKLETEGLFSPSKPEGLIEIAKDIHRHDLASEVEKFIKSQRKSASKEEKKGHKRPKSQPEAAKESAVDLHLKSNFEVTLTQATVLMQQVDILQRAITAGKGCRRKVEEAMKEARQTAERLAHTLQKAQSELEADSDSDRSSGDLSPLADGITVSDWETSRRRLPVQVQSPTVSDPATPTPKPRIPRKCAQEGLASLRAPVQETGNSAQSTASYVAKAHLQASTGGSPKPTRVKCPGLTNKPQSAPSTPLMERVNTQRTKPAVPPRNLSLRSPAPTQLTSSRPPAESPPVARLHHHAMLEHADSSDNYAFLGPAENEETEGCTGDDSGFSEAKQWTKHMQHLPDSPEQIHYYKSLNRSEIEETSYEDIQH